jgi:hypothetical protein
VLAWLTAVLIVVFRGDSHALIPLFAVGAFLTFTLSQAGMVMHWRRERGRRWAVKATRPYWSSARASSPTAGW